MSPTEKMTLLGAAVILIIMYMMYRQNEWEKCAEYWRNLFGPLADVWIMERC